MKFFLVMLLLCGITYGGYIYYRQSQGRALITASQGASSYLQLGSSSAQLGNLAAVLGASVTSTYKTGKDLLSNATGGASDPILNQLVSKTQETLKDLPQKEADKIKYEFCKGVVTEYEGK